MLDVGQANELKLAFRRAGYTNEDIKFLCEKGVLEQFRLVFQGKARVTWRKFRYHIVEGNYHCDVIRQFTKNLEGADDFIISRQRGDIKSNSNTNPSEDKWIRELRDSSPRKVFTIVQPRMRVIVPGTPYDVVYHTILEQEISPEDQKILSFHF